MLSSIAVEPIIIPESVRSDWDVADAVSDTYPGNLLPSRVARSAALLRAESLPKVLEATAAFGYRPQAAEIVRVAKLDRTTRPASDLPYEDQVLYSALVAVIRSAVQPGFVRFTGEEDQDYSTFEHFPLTQPDVAYVLESDVAAFYQYIDHERLSYELLGLTGRADVVEPTIRLLEGWQGRPRGLPQGPIPSYVLADIYIAPAARALERAGFSFSRHSDDFRVPGRNWNEVKRAQETLEGALHELGLVVAAKKLRTLKVDTYRNYVDRVNDDRLQRRTIRETLDELEAEDYVPTEVRQRRDVTDEEVSRASEVFRDQIAADRVDILSTRLIRRTLPILGSGADATALTHLSRLLSKYAHLTQTVATYLRFLMGTSQENAAVESTHSWLTSTTYRLPWQTGWILNAASYAARAHTDLALPALSVLASDTNPWFARGQAAICLAVHGHLPPVATYVDIYERSPRATRPDFLAAVVIGDPPWANSFAAGAADTPILQGVAHLQRAGYREWL